MEVIDIRNITINDYLRDKEIYVVGNYFKSECVEDVYIQVDVIAYIHRTIMSYPFIYGCSVISNLGKRLEEYKVLLKKTNRYIDKLRDNETNNTDRYIIEKSYKILQRAKESLSGVNKDDFYNIIKRSMVRNELTLEKVDGSNIRVLDVVEIGTLDKLNYNMIEDDIIEYIIKINKKGYKFDKDLIINKFINSSRLDYTSAEYIKTMVRFPIGTLKAIDKYRMKKRELDNYGYLQNIKKEFNREFGGE
ncbi:MAG: hypothetical protein ACRC7N_18665 [Clostridium sp.]